MEGLYKDLLEAKNKLTKVGQCMNDGKEQIYCQNKKGTQIWNDVQ